MSNTHLTHIQLLKEDVFSKAVGAALLNMCPSQVIFLSIEALLKEQPIRICEFKILTDTDE